MEGFASALVSVAVAAVLCVAVPCVAMNLLFPSLVKHAPTQQNYRGADVRSGLGIVWFVWLALVWMASVAYGALSAQAPAWIQLIVRAFPLLAGTCALGLFDDWAGDGSSRGFRGHFAALRTGELTTGMLKMVGVGLLALFTAIGLQDFSQPPLACVARIVCSCLVMALFANLVNLFDVRPLRATKVYLLSLAVSMVAVAVVRGPAVGWTEIVCLALACAGPVVATWRLDNHEFAMLGDAGANTMGALLGYLLAATLPLWLLALVAAVLAALNLYSEKHSFSATLPLIDRFDRLFRPRRLR